jgi:hypothetical protein
MADGKLLNHPSTRTKMNEQFAPFRSGMGEWRPMDPTLHVWTKEPPAELIDRIERGLACRGFYVFGRDDLHALWGDTDGDVPRGKILTQCATTVGAKLQQGWTRNVALFLRR